MKYKNYVYAFTIYVNPNNETTYLLFRGAGNVQDNKINIDNSIDYMRNNNGYKKLRNYHDMYAIVGEAPCILVDLDYNVVSDTQYSSQEEIASKHNIKLSRLAKRAYTEKDVVGSKRIIKMIGK